MDLIYATPERLDIGILHDYTFDLAYGAGENDFSLVLQLKSHCLQDDYIVYMVDTQNGVEEPTEYGGVVDAVSVDTKAGTVTYTGRTWHGILAGKVIEPEPGQDYRVVTGDAHEIISALLADAGLDGLFAVEDEPSEIQIGEFQFNRYTDLYTGICRMLAESGGKLTTRYQDKRVVLTAVWLVDYSQDDEWDSSQVDFKVKKTSNPCNHLVCLGQGDLKDRYVIHLFTDDNGGIQPYATTDRPIQDSDYILDKRNQILTGMYEVAQAYDNSSAAITDNYVALRSQPDDWADNYEQYYVNEDTSFRAVKGIEVTYLDPLEEEPANWSTRFSKYFTANGKAAEGITTQEFIPVNKKPTDWAKNWTNYYVHFWNGVEWSWDKVESISKTRYEKQTQKPSDWSTNYSTYYKLTNIYKEKRNKKGKLIKRVKVGKGYTSVEKVKKGKKTVVPTWKKGKYYMAYNYTVAPDFAKGLRKYRLSKQSLPPTWQAGMYYTKEKDVVAPAFKGGTYYRLYHDHYAELVRYGIQKLQEYITKGDTITINLSLLGEYDVGDIVGASENTTGVAVWQPVSKKIVNIKNSKKTITYQIGVNA